VKSPERPPLARVLIIDDDVNFNPVLTSFLSRHGYEARAAMNGREGLELALRERPDLILCDLDMPVLDGYGVLARIRAHEQLYDLPVIFLTGRAEPGQIREGMNVGADDYLTKPVNPPDLLNAIKARLTRRESEKKRAREQTEKAGQLFSGLIRDLRDPLSVVLGYTELLGTDAVVSTGPEQRRPILERMQEAIERMVSIMAETMFVAKSRLQRLPFDPASADLRHVCEMVVAGHEARARLSLEFPADEMRAVVDVIRIRQALENLVSNALKFSTDPVQIRLSRPGEWYAVEVIDLGIGIPEAEQAKLGEPFFRASNAANHPGNGLGLCIAKACVEQHGGALRISSTPGKGTRVALELWPVPRQQISGKSLPATGEGSTAVSVSPTTARDPTRGLTVLIVDDDALVRGTLRDMLERAGVARVLAEAGNAAETRLLLQRHTPDVLFLDAHLPDNSGFELLEELKPTTSVIFLSHAEEHAALAFDCDAVDFLLKPVSAERLLRSLEKVRERRPLAREKSRLEDTFLVKTLTEKRLIKVGDIRNIAAYGEYSWVYWDNGKGAMLRKSLKQWLAELPEEQFLRVHRGAIVNLAFLEKVERLPGGKMQLRLREASEPIAVSLRLVPALNRRLKGKP